MQWPLSRRTVLSENRTAGVALAVALMLALAELTNKKLKGQNSVVSWWLERVGMGWGRSGSCLGDWVSVGDWSDGRCDLTVVPPQRLLWAVISRQG